MGNYNSQSNGQTTEELLTYKEYLKQRPSNTKSSQLTTVPDDIHPDTQIIRRLIDITKVNQKSIMEYLKMLQEMRKVIDCDNLYLPAMYKVRHNDHVCSTYSKLEMFYEYYEVKLKEEVRSRRSQRDFFSEEEVWYILYSLVRACRKFQKFNMASGPLKTQMILLNHKGHLKLLNILSAPDDMKAIIYGIDNFYAPEQLRRDKHKRKINQNVAQTFSIGIILLEVCSLIDSQALYDNQRKAINQGMLNQVMSFVEKKYSKLLTSLIKTLISFNQNDRPLPSQIYSTFKPYQRSILSLKPFKFNLNGKTSHSAL